MSPTPSKPSAPAFLTPLLIIIPLTTLLLTFRFLGNLSAPPRALPRPSTSRIFTVRPPTHLPLTFDSISDIIALPSPLSSSLVVSDVSTNTLYYIHTSLPAFAIPLLNNAGHADNDTHAFSLRRPGIAGMALYDSSDLQVRIAVTRHAARDVALLALAPAKGTSLVPVITAIQPLTSSFNGSKLNSPHSIAVHPTRGIFFSDPTFGLISANDEFDRKLDEAEDAQQEGQHVYHLSVRDIETTMRTGAKAEPTVLIASLDRPTGVGLVDDQLFVAVSSPRRPLLSVYNLDGVEAREREILRDWTDDLHGWEQLGFQSLVVGHLCVVDERWVIVGAGNAVEVFDGGSDRREGGMVDQIQIGYAPGPQSITVREKGRIVVASGSRAMIMERS